MNFSKKISILSVSILLPAPFFAGPKKAVSVATKVAGAGAPTTTKEKLIDLRERFNKRQAAYALVRASNRAVADRAIRSKVFTQEDLEKIALARIIASR